MKVKAVILYFPNTDDCSEIRYEVGKKDITKIELCMYSPAEFCNVTFYRIYEKDKIKADIHHYSLVEYFKES